MRLPSGCVRGGGVLVRLGWAGWGLVTSGCAKLVCVHWFQGLCPMRVFLETLHWLRVALWGFPQTRGPKLDPQIVGLSLQEHPKGPTISRNSQWSPVVWGSLPCELGARQGLRRFVRGSIFGPLIWARTLFFLVVVVFEVWATACIWDKIGVYGFGTRGPC